ncbi:MAG: hypothetical protein ABSE46_09905 [Terracidiphilus sp.]
MSEKNGNCPYCKKLITELDVARITLHDDRWGSPNGFTYTCPSCHTVLNAGLDPAPITEQLVKDLLAALRKRS